MDKAVSCRSRLLEKDRRIKNEKNQEQVEVKNFIFPNY